MKSYVLWFALGISAAVFVAGCGKQSVPPRAAGGNPLTAPDLARLMDFHAWTGTIPKLPQPLKSIRLIIYKRNTGEVVQQLFETSNSSSSNWASVLFGFRAEHGTIVGKLEMKDADGGGVTWDINVTNDFVSAARAWNSSGKLLWEGNRAFLASNSRAGNTEEDILALEVVN